MIRNVLYYGSKGQARIISSSFLTAKLVNLKQHYMPGKLKISTAVKGPKDAGW
jgi:hypothetical protein